MDALMPCPFCGAEPIIDGKSDDLRVRCEGCDTKGPSFYFDSDDQDDIDQAERDAIAQWNRRPDAQPPADVNVAGETAGGRLGERELTRMLADLHREYQACAEPIVKALAGYAALKPPAPILLELPEPQALARSASQPPAPASRSGDAGGEVAKLQRAAAVIQQFKRDWQQVPYFADRVNKATRLAISAALSQIVNLDAVGGPLDMSHAPDATLAATSGATSAAKVEVEAGALASLRQQIREWQNNLETLGPYSQEAARVALDGVLDMIEELERAPS